MVTLDITNWEAPFGLEKFGKKTILNLRMPLNNEGSNMINILNQICDEILSDTGEYAKLPIKENGSYKLLRCELKSEMIVEKNDKVTGKFNFKIYNFKGNWGVCVFL